MSENTASEPVATDVAAHHEAPHATKRRPAPTKRVVKDKSSVRKQRGIDVKMARRVLETHEKISELYAQNAAAYQLISGENTNVVETTLAVLHGGSPFAALHDAEELVAASGDLATFGAKLEMLSRGRGGRGEAAHQRRAMAALHVLERMGVSVPEKPFEAFFTATLALHVGISGMGAEQREALAVAREAVSGE